ncbi:MAG: S41 family peptidase [Anaerolineae bacterium]|nr:S41 family peptidase [Anaerolineae bacterium]MDW8072105.1 S41 family peptidase [Anaerolineae bacterium]
MIPDPNKVLSVHIRVFLTLVAAVLIFTLGMATGFGVHWYLTRDNPTDEEIAQFNLFWEVWRLVRERYYGEIPAAPTPVYGAIRGALATLQDPYTIFVEPQPRALEKADLQGRFGGIGALVTRGKEGEVLLQPMPGSPAERAGIQNGDQLLKVDDTVITTTMRTEEIVLLIRGDVGTQVRLTLQRTGLTAPLEISVTRELIETPSVEWRILEPHETIGYLRIRMFTERTAEETRRALQDLLDRGASTFVLDLRGNGGGVLDAAVDVTSEILDSGVVLNEERRDQPEKSYMAKPGGLAVQQPLVVLVDGGTASASEIVAGALQDHKRATLVGEKTFGKGSVQLVFDLSDASSVHITVARWLTPNRQRIDAQGLQPDIIVPISDEERAAGRDPQLERAIAYLRERAVAAPYMERGR